MRSSGKRRVVVTGIGLVSPLACGAEATWKRLINGDNAVGPIVSFDTTDLSCKISAQVPHVVEGQKNAPHLFDPDQWVAAKERRKIGSFIMYALAAAKQALDDSGWNPDGGADSDRTGVIIGSGVGGLEKIYDASITLRDRGARRVSPFFIPSSLINLASGHVAIAHGLRGPNHATVTACSSGAHAIGDAATIIRDGHADVMVAGGAEDAICRLAIAGFCALRALSTGFNDHPERASRPWDQGRDGFVMGAGSGILILEEYEHARRRQAPMYAEFKGYGMSGDAYHITAPSADGSGAFRAMQAALSDAEIPPDRIDYINAHGTSTPLGDEIELSAMRRLMGDHISRLGVSSTKSSIGHLLGAAGSVEAIFSILAMRDGVMPPTRNLDAPDPSCADVNLVPHHAQERSLSCVLSNSFGFGGTNSSLIFSRL